MSDLRILGVCSLRLLWKLLGAYRSIDCWVQQRFYNAETDPWCKVGGVFFPEQESWTPSLLGHSPWIVNGNLLPVSNKAECRGDSAEHVVGTFLVRWQWGGVGAGLSSLLECRDSTKKLVTTSCSHLGDWWVRTLDIWGNWILCRVVHVLGWIYTITKCRGIYRERFCPKMSVSLFLLSENLRGNSRNNL